MQLGRMTRGKIAALSLVAAVAGGGGGAAWAASTSSASAATPAPTTTAPATAPATTTPAGGHTKAAGTHKKAGTQKKAKSILDRTDHATVELRKGTTWVTTTYDRGTVTAASGSSITLHRPDGQNVTIAITPTTKFKGVTSASQLVTGKQALVLSTSGKATRIAERS